MSIVWGQCQRHQSRTTSHHSDISRGNGPRCKRTDRWVLLSVMLLPSHAVNIQNCTVPVMLLPNHAVNIQNCTVSVMLLPNHAVNIQTAHCLLCCCQPTQLISKLHIVCYVVAKTSSYISNTACLTLQCRVSGFMDQSLTNPEPVSIQLPISISYIHSHIHIL